MRLLNGFNFLAAIAIGLAPAGCGEPSVCKDGATLACIAELAADTAGDVPRGDRAASYARAAEIRYWAGDAAAAWKLLARAFEAGNPGLHDGIYNRPDVAGRVFLGLARMRIRQGKLAEVEALIADAHDDVRHELWFEIAIVLHRMKDAAGVERAIKHGLTAEAARKNPEFELSHIESLAERLVKHRIKGGAQALAKRALEIAHARIRADYGYPVHGVARAAQIAVMAKADRVAADAFAWLEKNIPKMEKSQDRQDLWSRIYQIHRDAGAMEKAQEAWRRMAAEARSPSKYSSPLEELMEFAETQVKLGQTQSARNALRLATELALRKEHPPQHTLKSIAELFLKMDDLEAAQRIAVKHFKPKSGYRGEIEALSAAWLARKGRIDEALAATARLETQQARDKAYRAITEFLVKSKDVDRAIETVKLIQDETDRAYAVKEVAEVLLKQGRINEAIETVGKLNSAYVLLELASKVAVAQARAGQMDAAKENVKLAADIYRQAFRPSSTGTVVIQTFGYTGMAGHLIAAQVAVGDIDGALKTARSIQETTDKRTRELRAAMMIPIAIALLESGDVKQAERILDRAGSDEASWRTYRQLSARLRKRGKFAQALRYARQIDRALSRSVELHEIAQAIAAAKKQAAPAAR